MMTDKTLRLPPRVSFLSEDAIDVGLFGDGPARIARAAMDYYDYNGTSRTPPLVTLVTFERGEGRNKETSDQPYTMGKGLTLSRKTGELQKEGDPTAQVRLPKTCNTIVHLIKPLEEALKRGGFELPDEGISDPKILEGMEVVLARVPQMVRNIPDTRRQDPSRRREPETERNNDFGPKTILEIREVISVPWATTTGSEPARPTRTRRAIAPAPAPVAPVEEDEDDNDAPVVRSPRTSPARTSRPPKPNGHATPASAPELEPDEPTASLEEDANEAIATAIESGKLAVTRLEQVLERQLANTPNAAAIIDLAMSPKFLAKQTLWSISRDGKTLDARSTDGA